LTTEQVEYRDSCRIADGDLWIFSISVHPSRSEEWS
jgi:hypothetical protein